MLIIIGAGAGFSTSAGFVYDGERLKIFSDFRKKYGFSDMYSGGFYPYKTLEKHWGYWCRYIYINRYMDAPKPVYQNLYELVKEKFPAAEYDPLSGILKIDGKKREKKGLVAVCTAGTADIAVAEEAAQTAEYFGTKVERVFDVGVSGIHRLLFNIKEIQDANCVVAVAGMEGALASVIGGLVDVPVIAVPTSVGYGASFHGLSALLTMINSCANGIATVNIDNGYGAGYLATQINRLAIK